MKEITQMVLVKEIVSDISSVKRYFDVDVGQNVGQKS